MTMMMVRRCCLPIVVPPVRFIVPKSQHQHIDVLGDTCLRRFLLRGHARGGRGGSD